MKKRIIIAVAGAGILTSVVSSAGSEKVEPSDLRLMSYNVQHCAGVSSNVDVRVAQTYDITPIADAILRERPDFVGLNEVHCKTWRTGKVDYPAEFARRTGLHATFAQAIPYQGGGYGVAVLSREEPISVEKIPLPGREKRVLLLCEFQDFWFGTMHLDFGVYQLQAVEVVRLVVAEKAASKPVFITGDWNNVPKSNTLAALREFMTVISKEDCCTYHGRTDYPAEKEYCIDYIAVDSAHAPSCKVKEAYVTKNIIASDHNPLTVSLDREALRAVEATRKAAAQASGSSMLLDLAAPIASWDEGIPLGNGGAGALLWGGDDTLNVTLDRADYWHNIDMPNYLATEFTWETLVDVVAKKDDKRRGDVFRRNFGKAPTKIPGVRLAMKLATGQKITRFRLERTTGTSAVTVATPQGERNIYAWFDENDDLLSMHVPDAVGFEKLEFVKNASVARLGGYPEPEIAIDASQAVYRRGRRKGADNRFDKDFEAGVRFRGADDRPASSFWRRFNAESSILVPDAEMQRLYDLALYLYGAGARAGHPPLALQGLWSADDGNLPPWNGDYHNDLNTEMTYWAAGPAGKIEALEAFADFFIERLPECRAFCRKLFKDGEGAVIPPTMGFAGQPIAGYTAYTVPPIHGLWVFDTLCDAWDYDPTPEKAAKYLAFGRELAAGIEHAWKVVDGVRKLDVSCSPEYEANEHSCFLTPNSSYERAILDSFYVWLARLAAACGEAEEAAKWRAYVGTFGKPNVSADGALELADGKPLNYSHRHASHLLQVFPLVNCPEEDGVDFAQSVSRWEELGTKLWVGYSFAWAGCFEARLGRGDRAYRYLKDFQRAFVSRNGFHLNGDQLKCGLSRYTYRPFTLEGNFGYARGLQEMLLSYDPHTDTYKLFPALPKAWDGKEVSFRDLRLPGGHRVSAKRAADGTVTHTLVPNPRAKTIPRLAASESGK